MIKYMILTVASSLLFVFQAYAQRYHLMGPAAKNYKPSKNVNFDALSNVAEDTHITGPNFKNRKPAQRMVDIYPLYTRKVEFVSGPEAKNERFEKSINSPEERRTLFK